MADNTELRARITAEDDSVPGFESFQRTADGAFVAVAKSAKASADVFEREFARMERAADRMARDQDAAARRVEQSFASIYQAGGKSAEQSATAFEAEFARLERAAEKSEKATVETFRHIYTAADKSAEQSAAAFEEAFRQQEDAARKTAVVGAKVAADFAASYESAVQAMNAAAQQAAAPDGKAAAQFDGLQRSATAAHDAIAKFFDELYTSGAASEGSLRKLINLQTLYGQEIEAAAAAGVRVAPEVVAHYQRIGQAVEKAKQEVRQLSNTFQDQRGELTQAGLRWTGLGDAITQAAGRGGAFVAKAGIVMMALRETYGVLRSIGETIGIDYDAWSGFVANIQKSTKPVVNSIGDVQNILFGLTQTLFTLNTEYTKNAFLGASLNGKSLFAPLPTANPVRPRSVADIAAEKAWETEELDRTRKAIDLASLQLQRAELDKNSAAALALVERIALLRKNEAVLSAETSGSAAEQDKKAKAVEEHAQAIRKLTVELYKAQQAAESQQKGDAADAAQKTVRQRLVDVTYELDILRATSPYYREHLEYVRDLAIASDRAAAAQQALYKVASSVKPLVDGNIDLAHRPRVTNPDGSISTVRSLSFGTDQGEVLVPTVSDDGRIMSDREAMEEYYRSGKHLGIFRTPDEATRYAEDLHKQQEAMYGVAESLASVEAALAKVGPMQAIQITLAHDIAKAERDATDSLEAFAKAGKQASTADIDAIEKTRAKAIEIANLNAQLQRNVVLTDAASAGTERFGDFGDRMRNSPGVLNPVADAQAALAEQYYDKLRFAFEQAEAEGERQRALDEAAAQREIEMWQRAHEQVISRYRTLFADLVLTGGENLGKIAGARFAELASQGFDALFGALFGRPGDKQLGQDPNKLYDSAGKEMGPNAKRNAQLAAAAIDYAQIGIGAYGAARQGEGSRTGGVVGGAAAGFAVGNIWGAVIGAIAGALGGLLGEQARQDQYKYAHPFFDASGDAHLTYGKNIGDLEREAMIAQMQEQYDRIRNAWVHMFLKAQAAVPDFGAVDGKFQDRPSANFMKHWNEWISQGLPDEMFDKIKPDIQKIFSGVGISEDKFDELAKRFDKLDPLKMIGLFTELLEAMMSLNESREYFTKGYGQNLIDTRRDMNRSVDEVLNEDYFDKILDLGRGLKDLVGEDQIHALAEIARMQQEAANAMKAAMQEIVRLTDVARERTKNAIDNLTMMGMVDKEGNPDYERQAEFLKKRAEEALWKVQNAKTAAEADAAYANYIDLINQIVALGYNINDKTGEEYRKWAIEQLRKGQAEIEAAYERLGKAIVDAGEKFADALKPYIDAFTDATDDTGDAIGDLGDGIRKVLPPLDDFVTLLENANTALKSVSNKEAAQFSARNAVYTRGNVSYVDFRSISQHVPPPDVPRSTYTPPKHVDLPDTVVRIRRPVNDRGGLRQSIQSQPYGDVMERAAMTQTSGVVQAIYRSGEDTNREIRELRDQVRDLSDTVAELLEQIAVNTSDTASSTSELSRQSFATTVSRRRG